MELQRENLLLSLDITVDEVIELFGKDTLLSALGFDQPCDFLDEVTINDAIEHFGESSIVDELDINDYWDDDDAVERYGTSLLEHFDSYTNTDDWCATDYIEGYGDSVYLLEVLLNNYLEVSDLHEVIMNFPETYKQELLDYFNVVPKKHTLLGALLKAQYNVLKEA